MLYNSINLSNFYSSIALAASQDGNSDTTEPMTTSTVAFNQSTYSVDEDGGPAKPVLVLSRSSLTNISIEIMSSTDGSANGKHCKLIWSKDTINWLQEEVLTMFLDHTMSHFLLE